ncbi:MAG: hypothetical protein ACFB8W_18785 [Elainellaceae cyanobacterium]
MLLFLLPASVTFAIALYAFLTDQTTPNTHMLSWITVAAATIMWPITLPTMLRQHYIRFSANRGYASTELSVEFRVSK